MSKFGNFARRFEANNMLNKLVGHIEHQSDDHLVEWLKLWPCPCEVLGLNQCCEGIQFEG